MGILVQMCVILGTVGAERLWYCNRVMRMGFLLRGVRKTR
jgi:hypothetical protein